MRKLFDIMFDFTSPGAKIKRYAEIAYKVEMIFAGIFAGMVGLATMVSILSYGMSFGYILIMFLPALIIGVIAGAIIFFVALFGGWLSKIMLYGFGQLIESAEISEITLDKMKNSTSNSSEKVKNVEEPKAAVKHDIVEKTNVSEKTNFSEKPQTQTIDTMATKSKVAEELKSYNSGSSSLKEKLIYSLKYTNIDATVSYLSIIDNPAIKTLLTLPKEEIRGAIQEMIDSLD